MQKRYKKEQWLLACLEEAVEACHIEHVAQKARKEAKTKAREEAEKQGLAEEEDKRKQMEYLQQLQNKVLTEDATLLGGAEEFQIIGSKCKEITLEDKKG